MAKRYEASLAVQPPISTGAEAGSAVGLAATLQAFQRTTMTIASERAAARGTQAGAAVEGRPTLKGTLTTYGRAYNNAALRNYVISQYSDMEGQIARLEDESGNDVAAFKTAADGVRRGAMSGALPEARGDIMEMYQRRIAEGAGRIQAKAIAEQRQTNKAVLAEGLDVITDSISRKLTSGDPNLAAQAEDEELQYRLMVDGAVAGGDITPAEGIALRDGMSKRVTRQSIIGQFEHQLRDGDPVGFIGSVMAQPQENLSDEEKTEVTGDLLQRLNRWQGLLAEETQLQTAEQKLRWAEGEREATVATLRRKISVTEISDMVARDELDPAVGRTLANELQSPTRNIDDQAVKFQVETNLLHYTEEEIAGMGGLSHGTRADLILKRRQQSETWMSDQGAEEAVRRIDRSLGIPAGLGPQFQINITEEKATAAARARTYFYDLVEATPEEERQSKYFELADRAIKDMGTDLVRSDLAKARTGLQQYQDAVGSPAEMNERERTEYDATVKRYTDQISKLETDLGR